MTHQQTVPYVYGAVRRREVSSLSVYGAKNAFGAGLVLVSEVESHHRAFGDALRAEYGKIPTTCRGSTD